MPTDRYTHGHHESVLRSHTWRTAANSAAYLLPHLRPGQDLLDVGCGPGTITGDLARVVAPGRVVGADASAEVLQRARATGAAANLTFEVADAYRLPFGDATFDVAHAHQVLQHVSDPVAVLAEMRRVLRPGGTLAVRDGDYAGFTWAPRLAALDRWRHLYDQVTRRNRAEPDAGRYLLRWVRAAGFANPVMTSSTWTFADPDTRAWWGDLWADRCRHSTFAEQALAYGLSDERELAGIADAFRRWAADPDGTFVVLNGEVLATR